MSRIRIALALAVAAAVSAVAAGSSSAAVPTLNAFVSGDTAFKIGLTQKGKTVKTLKAGKYRIVVTDPATIHNFRLQGKGLNKATSVSDKVKVTWTVTFRKGKYGYVCDPHASTMKGSFSVT